MGLIENSLPENVVTTSIDALVNWGRKNCHWPLQFGLACWSIRSLALREPTDASVPGIVLASLSLIVMPLLAREKRRVARALGSAALEADSRQTDLCAWLSAILLGGLLVNAVFAWWWADPVAALAMVPIIAREGVQGLRGRACGDG